MARAAFLTLVATICLLVVMVGIDVGNAELWSGIAGKRI
jgi:hypothetical protein